jgi:hypothetical protein
MRKEGRAARPGVTISNKATRPHHAKSESSACFSDCRFGIAFNQAAYRIRWLRSAFYPVIDSLVVELNISRITARVVITNRFDEATISLRAFLGDNNSIERLLLRASSSQSDRKQNAPPCSLTEINRFKISITARSVELHINKNHPNNN